MTRGALLCIDVSNTLEATSLSGIQRVTIELNEALSDQVPVVALDGRSGRFVPLRPGRRRRLRRLQQGRFALGLPQRIENRIVRTAPHVRSTFQFDADSVLLDIEASWHAPLRRADLLPKLAGSPTAALIHDVLPITNPEWFPPESVHRFRSWFDAHLTAGSTLLAVSNATADAVAVAGMSRPAVIRMGTAGLPPISEGPGILMVGTIEPRKGHEIVLDALDLLGPEAPIIDVVGRAGWGPTDLADRLDGHPKVRWHRNIADTDVDALWTLSGILLQPSLGEGFGLPVVEALQRGVAVASSNIPVMHEVGRGHTTLLPLEAEAWATMLASFAEKPSAWPRPAQQTWPTWHESASDVLTALTAAGVWSGATSTSQ